MPLERDLLRDRAYATIRDAIVDGTLAPASGCATRSCARGWG